MISIFGWIVILFVLLIVKYAFLQPINDKNLYRLYEARDNVALAAIEGEISQDAEEYMFVIKNINFAIHYIKNNYNFSIVLKNIFVCPNEVQEYFTHMFDLVVQYDLLEKNYRITEAYFRKSLNVRLFIYMNFLIKPICYLLIFFVNILKISLKLTDMSRKFINAAERRIKIISDISIDYNEYKKLYIK